MYNLFFFLILLGSLVFNVLIIIGVSILVAPNQSIHLSGRVMFRDNFFYLVRVFLLFLSLPSNIYYYLSYIYHYLHGILLFSFCFFSWH